MEKTKTSKKALKGLIADSMKEAIGTLELPQPTKKVNKLLKRNSKKLASVFADMIRRENKKKKKAEKFMEDAVKTKSKKEKKSKGLKFAKNNSEAVSA
jgi:DNA integrity scanning protein DisA with diadenylate cyclase activity